MYLTEKATIITELAEDVTSEATISVEHLSNVLISPVRTGQRNGRDGATSTDSATLFYFPEQSVTDSPLGIPDFAPGKRIARGHLSPSKVVLGDAWTIAGTVEYYAKGKSHHIEVNLV